MRRTATIIVTLVVIAGCTTVVYQNRHSQRSTFRELRDAVEKRDLATFERYADVHALAEGIDGALPRPSNILIPGGQFTPQFVTQIEKYVRDGEPLAPGIAPIFDAIERADITLDVENPDGTRTVSFACTEQRNAAVPAAGQGASRSLGRRDAAQPAGADASAPLCVRVVMVHEDDVWRIARFDKLVLPPPPPPEPAW